MLALPARTLSACAMYRSVESSGVPSGNCSEKLNSPCETDGIRLTPRTGTRSSDSANRLTATMRTLARERSAQSSAGG